MNERSERTVGCIRLLGAVRLERPKVHPLFRDTTHVITAALPFVYSRDGEYAHRVRSATLHTCRVNGRTHAAYKCWCGMTLLSKRARLADAPGTRPICATCEGRSVGAGLLGAREIAGRAVMFRPMTPNA